MFLPNLLLQKNACFSAFELGVYSCGKFVKIEYLKILKDIQIDYKPFLYVVCFKIVTDELLLSVNHFLNKIIYHFE